jgi:hypothetical protein
MAHSLRWKTSRSVKFAASMLVVIWTSLQFSQATGVVVHAQGAKGPLDQFPIIVTCKLKDTFQVFQLVRITQDGTATYLASDRIAGTITLTGRAKAVGDDSGGDCVGKTLHELRAAGQAYFLKSR